MRHAGDVGAPTEQVTSSGPGWSTLLTGVWVDQHGVDSNNDAPFVPAIDNIVERVDAAVPDATIASVVNWAPISTGHFAREASLLDAPSIIDFERNGIPTPRSRTPSSI